jgi:glycosyltransferase involved in cell wall biosynthesis
MRILYISNSSSVGGAPAALYNIIEDLCKRHEVAVVLPDSNGLLNARLEALGVKCYNSMPYSLTIWPRVINPLKYAKRLKTLLCDLPKARAYVAGVIDEFRPDLVHTNVGPLDLAFAECQKRGIPHLWHLREYQAGMKFFPSESEFRRRVAKSSVVAVTRCVADFWGVDAPVVYDGVFKDSSVSEPDFSSDREKFFLFVGRVEKNKGLMDLLRAFKAVSDDLPEYRLKVVGAPSLLYSLLCRVYVRVFGLRVDFLGTRNDVPELMARASAYVMSSQTEGFGFTTVEAMLAGCPVIGRKTTGTAEIMASGKAAKGQRVALSYETDDELADGLRFAALSRDDGDELLSMRRRAFDFAVTSYGTRRNVEQIEKIYEDLVK